MDTPGPGSYLVRVFDPRQPSDQTPASFPGRLWDLGIAIVSGKRLAVNLRIPDGRRPEDCGVAFVQCTYTTVGGLAVQHLQAPMTDGRIRFDGIPALRATVEALDAAEKRLAVTFADLRESDNEVELSLTAAELKLRIVDAARLPVAGARVQIRKFGVQGAQPLEELSDERGLVSLPGLTSDALVLNVSHPDVGTCTNISIEPRAGESEPIDVCLDARATLRVRFLDHSQTLEGVRARILDARTDFEVASPISDAEGRIAVPRLAAGRYRLVVDDPDLWPVEQSVDATVEPDFTGVQVRRLGDLELRARTPNARPVARVLIDLHSVEFAADVATWVEEGQISAPRADQAQAGSTPMELAGLATDRSGELRIAGLPNGSYRWRATTCHGESSEGLVTIPPRGRAEVHATIG